MVHIHKYKCKKVTEEYKSRIKTGGIKIGVDPQA